MFSPSSQLQLFAHTRTCRLIELRYIARINSIFFFLLFEYFTCVYSSNTFLIIEFTQPIFPLRVLASRRLPQFFFISVSVGFSAIADAKSALQVRRKVKKYINSFFSSFWDFKVGKEKLLRIFLLFRAAFESVCLSLRNICDHSDESFTRSKKTWNNKKISKK